MSELGHLAESVLNVKHRGRVRFISFDDMRELNQWMAVLKKNLTCNYFHADLIMASKESRLYDHARGRRRQLNLVGPPPQKRMLSNPANFTAGTASGDGYLHVTGDRICFTTGPGCSQPRLLASWRFECDELIQCGTARRRRTDEPQDVAIPTTSSAVDLSRVQLFFLTASPDHPDAPGSHIFLSDRVTELFDRIETNNQVAIHQAEWRRLTAIAAALDLPFGYTSANTLPSERGGMDEPMNSEMMLDHCSYERLYNSTSSLVDGKGGGGQSMYQPCKSLMFGAPDAQLQATGQSLDAARMISELVGETQSLKPVNSDIIPVDGTSLSSGSSCLSGSPGLHSGAATAAAVVTFECPVADSLTPPNTSPLNSSFTDQPSAISFQRRQSESRLVALSPMPIPWRQLCDQMRRTQLNTIPRAGPPDEASSIPESCSASAPATALVSGNFRMNDDFSTQLFDPQGDGSGGCGSCTQCMATLAAGEACLTPGSQLSSGDSVSAVLLDRGADNQRVLEGQKTMCFASNKRRRLPSSWSTATYAGGHSLPVNPTAVPQSTTSRGSSASSCRPPPPPPPPPTTSSFIRPPFLNRSLSSGNSPHYAPIPLLPPTSSIIPGSQYLAHRRRQHTASASEASSNYFRLGLDGGGLRSPNPPHLSDPQSAATGGGVEATDSAKSSLINLLHHHPTTSNITMPRWADTPALAKPRTGANFALRETLIAMHTQHKQEQMRQWTTLQTEEEERLLLLQKQQQQQGQHSSSHTEGTGRPPYPPPSPPPPGAAAMGCCTTHESCSGHETFRGSNPAKGGDALLLQPHPCTPVPEATGESEDIVRHHTGVPTVWSDSTVSLQSNELVPSRGWSTSVDAGSARLGSTCPSLRPLTRSYVNVTPSCGRRIDLGPIHEMRSGGHNSASVDRRRIPVQRESTLGVTACSCSAAVLSPGNNGANGVNNYINFAPVVMTPSGSLDAAVPPYVNLSNVKGASAALIPCPSSTCCSPTAVRPHRSDTNRVYSSTEAKSQQRALATSQSTPDSISHAPRPHPTTNTTATTPLVAISTTATTPQLHYAYLTLSTSSTDRTHTMTTQPLPTLRPPTQQLHLQVHQVHSVPSIHATDGDPSNVVERRGSGSLVASAPRVTLVVEDSPESTISTTSSTAVTPLDCCATGGGVGGVGIMGIQSPGLNYVTIDMAQTKALSELGQELASSTTTSDDLLLIRGQKRASSLTRNGRHSQSLRHGTLEHCQSHNSRDQTSSTRPGPLSASTVGAVGRSLPSRVLTRLTSSFRSPLSRSARKLAFPPSHANTQLSHPTTASVPVSQTTPSSASTS